jgi:glutamate synthase domain-containing protein 2/glutamate synthase domain-containing protein 1/glutamate synthase domain-containing protein 3
MPFPFGKGAELWKPLRRRAFGAFMYEVIKNGKVKLEADACGIGFLASRKGVADRNLVKRALDLCTKFDHRGATGHGAGVQLDIPWPLLLDRFPEHVKLIAQRDVALGMFFLPFESNLRRECTAAVEDLARLAGSEVLQWEDVPINADALPLNSGARRTLPVVRQALLRRPDGLSEEGWFACRYLLRLALDDDISKVAGDDFSVVSLSNRTVVYKGLSDLSKIGELYPDLQDDHFASRFVLFHSRYCTNTTTAWRRAQPFWSLAHNGEISTIKGNVAWMKAIGNDLIKRLVEKQPSLEKISHKVRAIVASGGSDTANLDDMAIALIAGGMNLTQALLALMPEASSTLGDSPMQGFAQAMSVYLGACDGPAALVGCDGDEAVAHLDRNGLRPLWITLTKDYAFASSEPTGTFPLAPFEMQRILGPGETVTVKLGTGEVLINGAVHEEVARRPYPKLSGSAVTIGSEVPLPVEGDLTRLQRAFGMTKEDIDVVLKPLEETGKAAIGSMGDDTSPSAMLDVMPRRLEDHFALRFAQETSPPIDPIRDSWVFDSSLALGDRAGLWSPSKGRTFLSDQRIISRSDAQWLKEQSDVQTVNLLYSAKLGPGAIEGAIDGLVESLVDTDATVLFLSDQGVSSAEAPLPALRVASRLHQRLIQANRRHRVGIFVHSGIWDIHHCALLIALGADAVCPWLGAETVDGNEENYLKGLRSGFAEAMSMMGVTPASAYCGAGLVEAIGLDREFLEKEFPGVPGHLGGIGADILNREWHFFHQDAYSTDLTELVDAGEYRHTKNGRPHANNAEIVRSLQMATGYSKKIHMNPPGTYAAYRDYADLVANRTPISLLDCIRLKPHAPVPIEEVESVEAIAWRFMAPGMSEGALSEPAHRAVARGLNLLYRYCRMRGAAGSGIGPIANSGEGGFEKNRIGKRDGNRSVQYAGGRFTITPMTAACAHEAEVKFAQGAKPGKGGQLPGKKVSPRVAKQRGCEPGYELVSPPINHNLYSIEDVKLMVESWRHLNPNVNCALKYVATYGVEMVAMGGVNAGANRLHLSDGCGGTGAAKRVDQKHAGVPVVAMLPKVHDELLEEGVRHLVELSVDGGVQGGDQALKLMLLGADRVGFGTSLLIAIGCSMLRKCHLAGPDPADPTGKRRLGCAPGVATQDPTLVAKFSGQGKHIARYLLFVAQEIRERMAEHGIRRISDVIGRADFLEAKPDLVGKAAQLDFSSIINAPSARVTNRDYAAQTAMHLPKIRQHELEAAVRALGGADIEVRSNLTNEDRCVGIGVAGMIARKHGDLGLRDGSIKFKHRGAAGHFYAAYMVDGMRFCLNGSCADSAFTAAYGGKLVVTPAEGHQDLTLVGNAFGYGARGGTAFIAGRGGNRFGICFRKNSEGGGPLVVVEGVEANAFQYMTGGAALVLGPVGFNLGSGMTGGRVYLLDANLGHLNKDYVHASPLDSSDETFVKDLIARHRAETGSPMADALLAQFDKGRFVKVTTSVAAEPVEDDLPVAVSA